ncbi:MAG: universal stress protein [Azospirillaceae bacterium]|nr:universal stress protein [Azospirillaceae bacterium]
MVLVLLDHPDVAGLTLAAARNLADLMGSARINVIAIRMPPESTILPTEEILTRHQVAAIRDREGARVSALRRSFDDWAVTARAPGVMVDWADLDGLAAPLVTAWGQRADFLVFGPQMGRGGGDDRLELRAGLFATDRPVLVVPPGPGLPFGERVAIAWRDDKRTVRSVLAAVRLLSKARQVQVLVGVRSGDPEPRLPAILAEHDIAATLHVLPIGPGIFGAELLAQAHALDADLLVMGAYSHSPWREAVLGGVTRYMLAHADLPILMRH